MKRYFILSAIAVLLGYIKIHGRDNHRYTLAKANNLYLEVYQSGTSESSRSEYLTDSTNFRIYLGTYDEANEQIIAKCKGDNITVEKSVNPSSIKEWNLPKVTERKTYNLKDLKKQHVFE